MLDEKKVKCNCGRIIDRSNPLIISCPRCKKILLDLDVELWWNAKRLFMERVGIFSYFTLTNVSNQTIKNISLTLESAGQCYTAPKGDPEAVDELPVGKSATFKFRISPKLRDRNEVAAMDPLKLTVQYDIGMSRKTFREDDQEAKIVILEYTEEPSQILVRIGDYAEVLGDMGKVLEKLITERITANELILKCHHEAHDNPELIALKCEKVGLPLSLNPAGFISGLNFPRTRANGDLPECTRPSLELWFTYAAEERIQSFVVGKERIFIQSERGKVSAVEGDREGKRVWVKELNGVARQVTGCPPILVDDDKTIVAFNGSDEIVAFNCKTSSRVWGIPVKSCSSQMSILKGQLYIGSKDGSILEFETAIGGCQGSESPKKSVIYKIKDKESIKGEIICQGRMMFAASMHHLTAFIKGESTERYHYDTKTKERIELSPAALGDKIAIVTSMSGYGQGELVILQAQENAFKLFDFRELPGRPVSEPILQNDCVYIACHNGKVLAFRMHNGKLCKHWRKEIELQYSISCSMALSNNWLFIATSESDRSQLICIDTKRDGEIVAFQNFKSALCTPPVIANRMVYIATFDRWLRGYKVKGENDY